LVLLLQWSFDYEQVEEVGLLTVKLVIELVAEVFFQLESLFIRMILGPGTDKTIWLEWTVLDEGLGEE